MKQLLNNFFFRFVIYLSIMLIAAPLAKAGSGFALYVLFINLICGSTLLITGYDDGKI